MSMNPTIRVASGALGGPLKGFTLIEMLIALLVLSIGLLGMAGLQAYSLRNNTSAYHRSQANALVYDILDSMRTNRTSALEGSYNASYTYEPSATDQYAQDIWNWKKRLDLLLPSGTGEIACDVDTEVCRVTVIWDDARVLGAGSTCKTAPASCQQLTVSARL